MTRIAEWVKRANTPSQAKQALNFRAEDAAVDTANFSGTLSSADDTVQKALDTLDDYAPADASETVEGKIEHATTAEVRSAATGNLAVIASKRKDAAAAVALTDAATIAVDWESGVYFTVTITVNRILGNPTNEMPGTFIYILVAGNDATARTLTFGTQYVGNIPSLTDITSTQKYLLTVFCTGTDKFLVASVDAVNA